MNKIEKNNILSLIEAYILNVKLIPTYNTMIQYSPIINNAFKINKIDKQIAGELILEFFIKKLENYYIETGKFPFKENLLNYTFEYKTIFGVFNGRFEGKYEALMFHYFKKIMNTNSNTKMKNSLHEKYINNQVLFEDFFYLNLDKKNIKDAIFQDTGMEIKILIQEVEEYIVGRMEGGQYGVFSGSTRDKFIIFLKSFFPLYDQIGVTIKNS